MELDPKDRRLLNMIQGDFPLERRPFRVLGERLGLPEEEVFERVRRLKEEGIIRRLGGVFDSAALGYKSTLVAARVPEESVEEVAVHLQTIPGVTHNYLRTHPFNLWFTLSAPSEKAIHETLSRLRSSFGFEEVRSLPALRLFKIRVDFPFEEEEE